MKHLRGMPRSCTLCRERFHLIGPAMANPADIVCNDCLARWWADERTGKELETALLEEIRTDLGVDTGVIASGISRRMSQLRSYARDEAELALMLRERTPTRT